MIGPRWVLPTLLAASLAACSSVPLGTMWKLSRMGPEAVYQANPEEVRAAVRSADWFLGGPSFDQGVLRAELRSTLRGDKTWEFPLEETSSSEAWQLPEAPTGQRWRIYGINEESLGEFQEFQRILPGLIEGGGGEGDSGSFSLSVQFMDDALRALSEEMDAGTTPVRTETITLRIELKLDPDDGYFTLLDDHAMEVRFPEDMDRPEE